MKRTEGITGLGINDPGINRLAWGCFAQGMMTVGIMVGIHLILGGSLAEPRVALGAFSLLWIFNSMLFFRIQFEFKRMGERITTLEAALRNAEASDR